MDNKTINILNGIFSKTFEGLGFNKWRGKAPTLLEFMQMHRKIFKLTDNLHELMCRGTKDYREALRFIRDYNLSK